MKCDNCPALCTEGFEYPETYCGACVPEKSMIDFKDGASGCRYSLKQIKKRLDRYDDMRSHEYDGIDVFYKESEGTENAMRDALSASLKREELVLCYKGADGQMHEATLFQRREIPFWTKAYYEEKERNVQQAFCEKCRWKNNRPQKCCCCRRNRNMKDNYEERNDESNEGI